MKEHYDKLIIGAGIYGLYAALYCSNRGEKVMILEIEDDIFTRASYVNQARVHNGYHYPRSLSTALKSSNYFEKFNKDFKFAINDTYKSIYATSKECSWTSSDQFKQFCKAAKIKADLTVPNDYFKDKICDGAFITEEYTFDAEKIKQYYKKKIDNNNNIKIFYNCKINKILKCDKNYSISTDDGLEIETPFILNSTYASINQILTMLDLKLFNIKYEICEVILCKVSSDLNDVGITVMDGPFFSIMPFGKTGLHSLTSVTFTPHMTSYDNLPNFNCQKGVECFPSQLANCNTCKNRPKTAWSFMKQLAKKYLKEQIEIEYVKSLFAIKPILNSSEIDDSRPTVIRKHSSDPAFFTVLSGKINTIYDLNEVLYETIY